MTLIRMMVMAGAAGAVICAAATPVSAQTLAERQAAARKARQAEAAKAAQAAEPDPRVQALQKLLYRRLTTDFDATPAREVFEYLQTALDLNIVVRYGDDPVGHGIDPQTPITLTSESMRALDLLELVLERCSINEPCTWQLRSGFVEAGTKERLSAPEARELRTYAVDHLLFAPPHFDDAPPVGIDPGVPYGYYGDPYYGRYGGYGGYGGRYGRGYAVAPGSGVTGSIAVGPPSTTSRDDGRRERAEELIELILDTVEPAAWSRNGGDWATIRYHEGALVVLAPDYVHRKLAGYGAVPPPATASERPASAAKPEAR